MKESSEFELESAVRDWRDRLSQSPQFRAENLNELEAHLRDSITALRSQRLTDEEAFLIATRRIGNRAALEPEFAKVNAREVWLNRLFWMAVGIQLWFVIISAVRMASLALTFGLKWTAFSFTGIGLESVGLLLAFVAIQLITAVALIAAGFKLVEKMREEGFTVRQRPTLFRALLVLSAGFVLVNYLSASFEHYFLPGSMSAQAAAVYSVRYWSRMVLAVVEWIAPPILIFILARRTRQLTNRSSS